MNADPLKSQTAPLESRPQRWKRVSQWRDLGVFLGAVAIAIVFALLAPAFVSAYNLFNLLRQTSELGIVAMAMTILIASGEFDLSVGAIYAVTGVVTGLLCKAAGVNIWIAAAAGLSAAGVLGLLNGVLVTTARMNSFIATLATMMVYRGLAMVLSQGQPISTFPDLAFFEILGRAKLFGSLPVPVLWLCAWGVALFILLHRTGYGVKVLATGDNRQAADLAGLRTGRIKRLNFLITAIAAGFASLVSLGYLRTVTPTQGSAMELEAIAACVIGGTSMRGGVGSIFGTFLGAFIMAEVRTGLVLMGTDAYIQDACVGLIIAIAVIVNVRITKNNR